jgi:hypothetical protein
MQIVNNVRLAYRHICCCYTYARRLISDENQKNTPKIPTAWQCSHWSISTITVWIFISIKPSIQYFPAFWPLPLLTKILPWKHLCAIMHFLKWPSFLTTIGQNGADVHSGTINVSLHFSCSNLFITCGIKRGRGTNQLLVHYHVNLNASIPAVPGHQNLE